MANSWDELLRMLVRANPQDFVSLVSSGTHYLSDITQKLITRTVEADFLCKAVREGQEVVIHIEFQRSQDENMGKRMWEYNCITSFLTHLPVCSSVIYLWKESNIVEPPYKVTLVDGKVIHILYYDNIFLWEMPPEVLKQKGLEGLLPLLPLTKDADKKRDVVISDMINGLRAVGKDDLLALGYTVERRFAELAPLAQQQVERITSPELLSSLIDRLFTLQTSEQARQMLMEAKQTPDVHS